MRKKVGLILIFIFFFVFTSHSFADKFKLAGILSYYSVSDSIYKDTYGSGNLMFGVYLNYELFQFLEIMAEANYYQDKGEMTLTKEEVKFTLTPLVLAIRGKLPNMKTATPYLGVGLEYYLYKEDLPDRFEDVSEATVGFHVEAGVYVNVLKSLFLDLNFRYVKADAKPFDETIKLGGLRAGLGIGFRF
jgi:opacity protein-like surface antigen